MALNFGSRQSSERLFLARAATLPFHGDDLFAFVPDALPAFQLLLVIHLGLACSLFV